jgi:hypothetical protein
VSFLADDIRRSSANLTGDKNGIRATIRPGVAATFGEMQVDLHRESDRSHDVRREPDELPGRTESLELAVAAEGV